jgi:hypothetical protein
MHPFIATIFFDLKILKQSVGGRVPSTIESEDAEADSAKGSATDTDSMKDPDSKWGTGSVVVAPVRTLRDNG